MTCLKARSGSSEFAQERTGFNTYMDVLSNACNAITLNTRLEGGLNAQDAQRKLE